MKRSQQHRPKLQPDHNKWLVRSGFISDAVKKEREHYVFTVRLHWGRHFSAFFLSLSSAGCYFRKDDQLDSHTWFRTAISLAFSITCSIPVVVPVHWDQMNAMLHSYPRKISQSHGLAASGHDPFILQGLKMTKDWVILIYDYQKESSLPCNYVFDYTPIAIRPHLHVTAPRKRAPTRWGHRDKLAHMVAHRFLVYVNEPTAALHFSISVVIAANVPRSPVITWQTAHNLQPI